MEKGARNNWRLVCETWDEGNFVCVLPQPSDIARAAGSCIAQLHDREVHDVFPTNEDNEEDPLSLKKLKKFEGTWALIKDISGFEFDGDRKTD